MQIEREKSRTAIDIAERKPQLWEYLLTEELLRSWVLPIEKKFELLVAGFYVPSGERVSGTDVLDWLSAQIGAFSEQVEALTKLLNDALPKAWGIPGQPGDENQIILVCSLIADSCQRVLEIEEQIKAAKLPDQFKAVKNAAFGRVGSNIAKVARITDFLQSVVAKREGRHEFLVIVSVPDGWADEIEAALQKGFG